MTKHLTMTAMKNKDIFGFSQDFSHIDSLDDLQKEIRRVKLQIEQDNIDIKQDIKLLPRETIRATVGSILPLFLKAKVADNTWGIIQTVASFLVANPFKKGNAGAASSPLLNVAKQVGFFAAVTGIKKFFARKKKDKPAEIID